MEEQAIITVKADQEDSWLGYANPLRPLRSMVQHRELIWQLTRRNVAGRYRGSYLGMFWALMTPLMTLGVYTVVFGAMNRGGGWGGRSNAGILDFAIHLFIGIILFGLFSDAVSRAPAAVTGNPNFVKKAVFPLELLAIAELAAAVVHCSLAMVIEVVAVYIALGHLPATALLLPALLVPVVILTLGMSWLLSGLGVFFRDLESAVGPVLQLSFFLTPIVYDMRVFESHPLLSKALTIANPFVTIVVSARQLLIEGVWPDFAALGWVTFYALAVAMVGYIVFMKLRRYFADAI